MSRGNTKIFTPTEPRLKRARQQRQAHIGHDYRCRIMIMADVQDLQIITVRSAIDSHFAESARTRTPAEGERPLGWTSIGAKLRDRVKYLRP